MVLLKTQDRPAFTTGTKDGLTLEQRAKTLDPRACYEYALHLYYNDGSQAARGRAIKYMGIAAVTIPDARRFLLDVTKRPIPKPNMDVVGAYRHNLNPEIITDYTQNTTEVYGGTA